MHIGKAGKAGNVRLADVIRGSKAGDRRTVHRGGEQLDSESAGRATFEWMAHAVGLLAFGVLLTRFCDSMGFWMPRPIYFERSFTWALLAEHPPALLFSTISAAFFFWLLLPASRGRFSWQQVDSVGGLRWSIFAVAFCLTWNYAGHPYNYFFNQAHVWDRWLVVGLMFATLRSPLMIPAFVLALAVSRLQFSHPINSMTLITDELPVRVLWIVVACAVWNGVLDELKRLDFSERSGFARGLRFVSPIPTRNLVYAILCLIGFYYAFAGIGKLMLGANMLDWVRFSHLENLHVGSHLNGWLSRVSDAQILANADRIRPLGPAISLATLMIELGMIMIVARQRATVLLLAAVCSMHLGILAVTGIFFWKWLVLEISLVVWFWLKRNDDEVRRIYSKSRFVVSLLIIAALATGLSRNDFAWWNTKWIMLYQVEVLDDAGNVYVLDVSDLPNYELFDLYRPSRDPNRNTVVYGMSKNQRLMQVFEEGDAGNLRQFLDLGSSNDEDEELIRRMKGVFAGFMKPYFRNRNMGAEDVVFPFSVAAPAKNIRHSNAPNVYRDQAPVVKARLRFIEMYYTGQELKRMRDEVVYSIPIPPIVLPVSTESG